MRITYLIQAHFDLAQGLYISELTPSAWLVETAHDHQLAIEGLKEDGKQVFAGFFEEN